MKYTISSYNVFAYTNNTIRSCLGTDIKQSQKTKIYHELLNYAYSLNINISRFYLVTSLFYGNIQISFQIFNDKHKSESTGIS
jgi:hypothetical protein